MTSDEARAQMDAALDGDLTGDDQAAFEQALSRDPALRAEYDKLVAFANSTRALAATSAPQGIDLLSGVQQRLRERSGGRFYRDRFAEAHGRTSSTTWMLVLAVIMMLAVAAWLAFDAGVLQPARLTP